jgi:2OG-Fe(II) oxygenase superfamily
MKLAMSIAGVAAFSLGQSSAFVGKVCWEATSSRILSPCTNSMITMESPVVPRLEAKRTGTGDPAKKSRWSVQLFNLLNKTKHPPGSFAMTSPLEPLPFPHPIISVQGVGTISFPLMKCAVEPVKAAATKAPFGLGNETLLDDTIRDAWQIEASKVTFGGGSIWDDFLKKVVNKACFGLGISDEDVKAKGIHANLYKMLLYETGGHFTPHRDTEKEDGMFGTLIVQLPSAYSGGDISVKHGDQTKAISLFEESDSSYHVVAFFADCEHQLHPVTSGVRLCLVFNLVALPKKKAPNNALSEKTEAALNSIAEKWKADKGSVARLGYQLGHHYTPYSFGFSSLKGKDDFIVKQLLWAKAPDGRRLFEVKLVLMEREITKLYGSGDDNGEIEEDDMYARLVLDSNGDPVKDKKEWEMYKRKDGWMTHEKEDDDESDDNKKDEWGNEIRSEHKMFHGVEPEIEEPLLMPTGNAAAEEKYWYYAAAVVISLAPAKP